MLLKMHKYATAVTSELGPSVCYIIMMVIPVYRIIKKRHIPQTSPKTILIIIEVLSANKVILRCNLKITWKHNQGL